MPVRPDGAEDHDVPVLSGGTVVLRRPEERDVPQPARNCADPAASEHTTVPLGYTEAACRPLDEHAFESLGLTYACGVARVPHWAGRKLAWRLGFRSPVRIDGSMEQRGASVDAWILTLGAEDPRSPRTPWDGPPSAAGEGRPGGGR